MVNTPTKPEIKAPSEETVLTPRFYTTDFETEFDRQVVSETNETAGSAFPVMLNTEHPKFFPRLHRCSDYNLKIAEIEGSSVSNW